jgi:hypothetical protein
MCASTSLRLGGKLVDCLIFLLCGLSEGGGCLFNSPALLDACGYYFHPMQGPYVLLDNLFSTGHLQLHLVFAHIRTDFFSLP